MLVACGKPADPEVVDLDRADALWGGDAGFCARTGAGLACWSSAPGAPVARGPTIVAGLSRVTEVAIGRDEACALHAGDVICFVPGFAESRGRSFDQPTHLAALDAETLCVTHASGASCWTSGRAPAPLADPQIVPSPGSPRATDGRFTCALEGAGNVRCTPRSAS